MPNNIIIPPTPLDAKWTPPIPATFGGKPFPLTKPPLDEGLPPNTPMDVIQTPNAVVPHPSAVDLSVPFEGLVDKTMGASSGITVPFEALGNQTLSHTLKGRNQKDYNVQLTNPVDTTNIEDPMQRMAESDAKRDAKNTYLDEHSSVASRAAIMAKHTVVGTIWDWWERNDTTAKYTLDPAFIPNKAIIDSGETYTGGELEILQKAKNVEHFKVIQADIKHYRESEEAAAQGSTPINLLMGLAVGLPEMVAASAVTSPLGGLAKAGASVAATGARAIAKASATLSREEHLAALGRQYAVVAGKAATAKDAWVIEKAKAAAEAAAINGAIVKGQQELDPRVTNQQVVTAVAIGGIIGTLMHGAGSKELREAEAIYTRMARQSSDDMAKAYIKAAKELPHDAPVEDVINLASKHLKENDRLNSEVNGTPNTTATSHVGTQADDIRRMVENRDSMEGTSVKPTEDAVILPSTPKATPEVQAGNKSVVDDLFESVRIYVDDTPTQRIADDVVAASKETPPVEAYSVEDVNTPPTFEGELGEIKRGEDIAPVSRVSKDETTGDLTVEVRDKEDLAKVNEELSKIGKTTTEATDKKAKKTTRKIVDKPKDEVTPPSETPKQEVTPAETPAKQEASATPADPDVGKPYTSKEYAEDTKHLEVFGEPKSISKAEITSGLRKGTTEDGVKEVLRPRRTSGIRVSPDFSSSDTKFINSVIQPLSKFIIGAKNIIVVPNTLKGSAGWALTTSKDTVVIALSKELVASNKLSAFTAIVHELGHAVLDMSLRHLPADELKAITAAAIKWQKTIRSKSKSQERADAVRSRSPLLSNALKDKGANKDFNSAIDDAIKTGDVNQDTTKVVMSEVDKSVKLDSSLATRSKYATDPHELTAEQFVRFVYKELSNGSHLVASKSKVMLVISSLVDLVRRFYRNASKVLVGDAKEGHAYTEALPEFDTFFKNIVEKYSNEAHIFNARKVEIKADESLKEADSNFTVHKLTVEETDNAATPGDSTASAFLKAKQEDPMITLKNTRLTAEEIDAVRKQIAKVPLAVEYGLLNKPIETVGDAVDAKNTLLVMTKVTEAKNRGDLNIDKNRTSWLLNTALFKGAQSISNLLLHSKNDVVKFMSSIMFESPSNLTGKRAASMGAIKEITKRGIMANYKNAYTEMRDIYMVHDMSMASQIKSVLKTGEGYYKFDVAVAEHLEQCRLIMQRGLITGDGVGDVQAFRLKLLSDAEAVGRAEHAKIDAVITAAAQTEALYARAAAKLKEHNVLGSKYLPKSSVGYMPHKISSWKFAKTSVEEVTVLRDVLKRQLMGRENFDPEFADKLANAYIDVARRTSLVGREVSFGIQTTDSIGMLTDSLKVLKLTDNEKRLFQTYIANARYESLHDRLNLDLLEVHTVKLASGETKQLRLLDIFSTDQVQMASRYSGNVGFEVAAITHGIHGRDGMQYLLKAAEYGDHPITPKEVQAFKTGYGELIDESIIGSSNAVVDGAMAATSLARLGWMGFTQYAENINGMWYLGAANMLKSLYSTLPLPEAMSKLRAEVKQLVKTGHTDNPWLSSVAELDTVGLDKFRFIGAKPEVGEDYFHMNQRAGTLNNILSNSLTIQGKLSGYQAIGTVQSRFWLTATVKHLAKVVDGTEKLTAQDIDMGITQKLISHLRATPGFLRREDGLLSGVDFNSIKDTKKAFEVQAAVSRMHNAIIQHSMIGEKGLWANESITRAMTQFRDYSILAIDKQFNRRLGTYAENASLGVAYGKMAGYMFGSLAMSFPFYVARTYVASIGRADQEEFLDRRLTVPNIAANALNFMGGSGLLKDFIDATSYTFGFNAVIAGTKNGRETNFVGGLMFPSVKYINDIYSKFQNSKEGVDVKGALSVMPYGSLPYTQIPINGIIHDN